MNTSTKEITINVPGIIFAFFFEVFQPFLLSFIWIKYFKGKIFPIIIGIIGFISSVGIESIFLILISKLTGKTSTIFYLFAGLFPGLFEETGKYISLKYLLSKEINNKISISYGIGHGGIESITIGISLLSNILAKDTLIEQGILKENITLFICLMGIVERIFSIMLQISLSVIIFKAIKDKKIKYYILAIILHDGVDLIAILKVKGFLSSIILTELMIGIYSFFLSFYAYKLYNDKENLLFEDKQKTH